VDVTTPMLMDSNSCSLLVSVYLPLTSTFSNVFGQPLQVTVHPVLWDHCPACPFCNISVLWPDVWMDQDATWYRGRPRLRQHFVRMGPSSPPMERDTVAARFSAHVYCGQMVAHLSYC